MNGDHDWRVIVDKDPTCTEDGQSHEQCYDCEIIKEDSDKVLPAKGHNWGYEYIRQATCTEDGYKSYDCMNKGCTATKKDTLPATGHKLEEYTKYEANSHKGTRYIYCVNCNYSRTEAAPESSHVFTPWLTDSQATVFSPEIQSRSCDICGLTENRKYGKKVTATMRVNVTAITLNTSQSSSRLKVTRFSERGQCQGMDIWQQQDRESYWKTQWNLRSNRRQGNRQNRHYHHYEERHKENSHDNCQKACCQNQKDY